MSLPSDPYLILFNFWDRFGGSPYLKPALIIGAVFVLIFLVALVKKHIFEISMQGALFGFVLGIIVMVVVDLIIVIGMADREKVGQLTSDKVKDKQGVMQNIFISGAVNLGNILGVSTTAVPKERKTKTTEEVIADFMALPEADAQKLKTLLCPVK